MMCSLLSLRALRVTAKSMPVAAGLVMVSAGAFAQEPDSDSGPKQALSIVPRVSVTETLTDNVRLSSVGQQSDLITEISPGIRIIVDGARVKGYFDYALNAISYAKNSSRSHTQNALNTFGTLEAVDNWAFIDFSGSISQQAVSAFGTQSIDNTSVNANRSEVSNYRLSPYLRGRLGNIANYEARYSRAVTDSDAAIASRITTVDSAIRLTGDSPFTTLGWSADASQQRVDFSAGRSSEADRFGLGLSYRITPQLSVSANAGREANNYISFDKRSYSTSGFGVNWSPSERTRLSVSRDRRFFGNAHSLSFEHRTPLTAWKFTDSKDVLTTPTQLGIASRGTIFDLLQSQFASIQPDPVLRAQLVSVFLQATGISPGTPVVSSFLTSAVSLQRRQDLLFALLGVRDTITFIATRSESSRLDTVSRAVDDFTRSSFIRQRGFSVNYAHRLTPDYSLGVLASQQKTSGVDSLQNIAGVNSLQNTTLRALNVNVTGKLGKQTAVSVGLRRVVARGASPYDETAVLGSLTVQF